MIDYLNFEKEYNMKLLLFLLVFFNIALFSFANCYTGFACSISEIENQAIKQFNQYQQNLENYFSKKINEDSFFSKKPSKLTYNDLFIFNTIV